MAVPSAINELSMLKIARERKYSNYDGGGAKQKGCTDPNADNYLGVNSFTPNFLSV